MTPHDLRALDCIRRSITVLGFAPTVRELADEIGIALSGTHRVIDRLVEAGKLRRTAARTRGLDLPGQPDLRIVDSQALRDELARRGETLDRLAGHAPLAYGRRAASCAADCCQVEVRRGQLFCRTHWFALPRDLQDGIKQAFARRDTSRYQELVAEARDIAEGGGRWRRAS